MRLISFVMKTTAGGEAPRMGLLLPPQDLVVDLEALPESGALSAPGRHPGDPLAWLDMDGELWPLARERWRSLERGETALESLRRSGALLALEAVELAAPVPRPGKIICIGANYREHALETGRSAPERPLIFSKFSTAVTAPGAGVILPRGSAQVDYEAELAVIIGRRAKGVTRERALDFVAGYTNFNDVTARDFQYGDGQFQRGKSCDTFAPMGPFIASRELLPRIPELSIRLRLNGGIMQDSNTREMIFGVPELVEFISAFITLEPGDVIATGTPPGVGFARKPQVFLKPGDRMEVEIQGLGVLGNTVTAEA